MLVFLHILLLFPFEDIFILLPYRADGVLDAFLLVLYIFIYVCVCVWVFITKK